MWHLLRRQLCPICPVITKRTFSQDTAATTSIIPTVQRIFSGIQPTGQIHLGNYFGAIRKWVAYQADKRYTNTIYSIVDLHAITLPQNPDELEKAILEATATLLACGIDPDQSILFLQSHVEYHTQLTWVLGSLTTMPRLSHLPQFKEKSKTLKDIPLGLYTYPVLQAADILLYNATEVPVGEDNVQHIQLAQHLARTFNRLYGPTFVVPKPIVEDGLSRRLRSLRKPENKMSKSEPDPKSRISLVDTPEQIMDKIRKAVTDSTSAVAYDIENRPGVSNLIEIHSLCCGQSVDDIVRSVSHLDTGKYKVVVAEALIEFLRPIRLKLLDYLQNPEHLIQVLSQGGDKARSISDPIWDSVCYKVGISPKKTWYSSVRVPRFHPSSPFDWNNYTGLSPRIINEDEEDDFLKSNRSSRVEELPWAPALIPLLLQQ